MNTRTRSTDTIRAAFGAAAAVALVTIAAGAQQTAETHATAGRATYAAMCASCHLPDRSGRNEAPSLRDTAFLARWSARRPDLSTYIQASMPPTDAGSLTAEAATNLATYLLNPDGAQSAPPSADAASTPVTRTGLIVPGEVKNYVPVTDEMLRNPDPGDWLMARRNYQGWSYSPLTQITRDNVKESAAGVGAGR